MAKSAGSSARSSGARAVRNVTRQKVKAQKPENKKSSYATQIARKADEIDVSIGKRLRERRTVLGITQEQLAAEAGISFQQIQKYETGENRISAARLYQFSELLDVSITWFFNGKDW